MKRWGRLGGREGGHERVSLAERSLSISQQAYSALHPPPLNESHNKASSVCVVSSSIHVPRGKHSPSFFNSPLLSPPPLSLTSSFSLKPLENCSSQRSPPSRSGSVNIFNSTCLRVCVFAHV